MDLEIFFLPGNSFPYKYITFCRISHFRPNFWNKGIMLRQSTYSFSLCSVFSFEFNFGKLCSQHEILNETKRSRCYGLAWCVNWEKHISVARSNFPIPCIKTISHLFKPVFQVNPLIVVSITHTFIYRIKI